MQIPMSGTTLAQPRWNETILGGRLFRPQDCTKEPRGPVHLLIKAIFRVPLGVNKSGKGEKYVSDLCSCLVHLMGI
jgi:hypothetical protein